MQFIANLFTFYTSPHFNKLVVTVCIYMADLCTSPDADCLESKHDMSNKI
jgi:hypothetical protein